MDLVNAVGYIYGLMDFYYTPDENGSFPALTQDDKKLMTSLYLQHQNANILNH